ELSNRTLQYLVDAAHWQRYCDSALQRSLKRDANFIWCSKCGGGGWVDPTQPTSKCGWNCPLCDNSFVYCPLCRRDHGSVSCKRFHKLRKEVVLGKQQAQDRDSAGVVQRSSKSCPSCKMPIQKDGGCNYMDCPNCRRHFCWSCGQIMKSSHQKHKCDAGFEASGVVGKTTQGRPCVELTRLFMNVIDIDSIEVMNVDDDDVQDCKDMLVPSADQEAKSPLFVGPSQMDGEILLRLPFNFTSAISWEVTHIHVRATHPPAPNCCRPKSLGLLANSPSATFSDFDDSTADFDPSSLVLAQAKQPPADAPAQIVLLEKDDMQAYCTEAYGLQDQPLWAGLKLRLEKERAARSRAKSNAARQKAIAALEVVEEGETEEAKQEPKATEEQVDVLFLIEAPADAEDLQAMSDAGLYEVVDLWTSIFFEGKSVDEADPTVEVPSEVPAGPQLFYEAIHTASTSADVAGSTVCTISDSQALAFEAESEEPQENEVPPTEKTPSERVLAAMLDVVGKEARSRMRYKAWLEAQLHRALCIRSGSSTSCSVLIGTAKHSHDLHDSR
ncbi:RNF14, partial [Symbiodinium sp. CCMP2592]